MLVKQDQQQRVLPIRPVTNRIVSTPHQSFAVVSVGRTIELPGVTLRMQIIVRAPHKRIEIDGFDERIMWQSVRLAGGREELVHMGKMPGQAVFPERLLY